MESLTLPIILGWVISVVVSIVGSGFAAHLGVRIAITDLRGKIEGIDKELANIDKHFGATDGRVDRLETPYFRSSRGE